MKFIYSALFLAMLPLTTTHASEGFYIGAGAGAGIVGLSEEGYIYYRDDTVSGIGQFFTGYRFSNNWGVELAYQQFNSDTSRSEYIGVSTVHEWNAEMTTKQLIIKPVYFWEFAPAWTLKGGLGLAYSNYDFSGSSHIEVGFDEDFEQSRGSVNHSDSAWGIAGSVGVEYAINERWMFGIEASSFADDLLASYQLLANIVYRF